MRLVIDFMSNRYRECLNYPAAILLMVFMLCVLAFPYTRQFSFDASADTLVAEGDPDLAYYQEIAGTFGGDEFLFFTYEPNAASIFNQTTLDNIQALVTRLEAVPGVRSVTSILDAPLLKNPPVPLAELSANYKTLRSPGVDLALAQEEISESPFFRELLISPNGKITVMRIDLEVNPGLPALDEELDSLLQLDNLSPAAASRVDDLQDRLRDAHADQLQARDSTLEEIRQIKNSLDSQITTHLGGVLLIASDMIGYVQQDIAVFGSVVLGLIALMLFLIFRRLRWVVLPLITTAVAIYFTIGILGYLHQPTTVISSNFISLLMIITISFSIHLISKYRELRAKTPDERHTKLVFDTMTQKLKPCLFTAITTIFAFGSLATSDIVPVRDFGWIMCISILISFLVTYSLFAGILLFLPKGDPSVTLHYQPPLTRLLSQISINQTRLVLGLAVISAVIAVFGINRLSLGNRFIDYFRSGTEVHQGLAYIDTHLGGTIPLDIILEFPRFEAQALDADDDFFTEVVDDFPQRYWFTPDKIAYLARMEQFLTEKPEIGKVISLATLEQIGREFNGGKVLGSVELVAALGAAPAEIRKELIAPYASPERGLMRISARLHETGPAFSHDELIGSIESFAVQELGLAPDRIHVTGMAVLFNGMLKNLYDSQQSTLIFVITATFLLFVVLLRSPLLALLGLLPNILAAATVLGFMGFVGIPLDMMTITIAAIIIGIGVDDAIHYLHQFKEELDKGSNVRVAVENSHKGVGDAIYYTSATVVIGFSVLGFSNFIPTVYFGILTALAMVLALTANLSVLPALLIYFYRKGSTNELATS